MNPQVQQTTGASDPGLIKDPYSARSAAIGGILKVGDKLTDFVHEDMRKIQTSLGMLAISSGFSAGAQAFNAGLCEGVIGAAQGGGSLATSMSAASETGKLKTLQGTASSKLTSINDKITQEESSIQLRPTALGATPNQAISSPAKEKLLREHAECLNEHERELKRITQSSQSTAVMGQAVSGLGQLAAMPKAFSQQLQNQFNTSQELAKSGLQSEEGTTRAAQDTVKAITQAELLKGDIAASQRV